MSRREAFNWANIHPVAETGFRNLATALEWEYTQGTIKQLFLPFEGYRTPERQAHLYTVEKTTKARPWESAHQYGLAVDFVPFVNKAWSWDDSHDWQTMRRIAHQRGLLTPLKWDLPHVEHPEWVRARSIMRRC